MPVIEPKDPSIKTLQGIHLYHFGLSSCSQRVRIALAEKGQEYVDHHINLIEEEHATPEYQAIHPDGLVPAFVHDGVLMIESVDIIDYIDKTFAGPTFQPDSDADQAKMWDWLRLADDVQRTVKLLTHEFLLKPKLKRDADQMQQFAANHQNEWLVDFMRVLASDEGFPKEDIDKGVAWFDDCFRQLDTALADADWLVGGKFTLADIAWLPNVHRMELMHWDLALYPNLLRWYQRCKERPSYRTALAAHEPGFITEFFEEYTRQRISDGTSVMGFGPFAGP